MCLSRGFKAAMTTARELSPCISGQCCIRGLTHLSKFKTQSLLLLFFSIEIFYAYCMIWIHGYFGCVSVGAFTVGFPSHLSPSSAWY
uniref:Uncharacterized protein n=1 Tax=Picea sitchensis TaxID=3332 RepID=A9NKT8_PICSI|nr:unknown [Picea sitchensis]